MRERAEIFGGVFPQISPKSLRLGVLQISARQMDGA
jgi:hypothetical protein